MRITTKPRYAEDGGDGYWMAPFCGVEVERGYYNLWFGSFCLIHDRQHYKPVTTLCWGNRIRIFGVSL